MKTFLRFARALSFAAAVVCSGLVTTARAAELPAGELSPAGSSVGPIPTPAGLTPEEVRDIVIVSLIARRYALQAKSDRHAVGYLNHRGHEATLTFVIQPAEIAFYCEAYAVRKSGQRVKPETPHGWINNLRNDITRRMAIKLATK